MEKMTDWETIRLNWCAGASARELAKAHKVSHTTINTRARKEGWERVSTAQVSPPQPEGGNFPPGNLSEPSNGAGCSEVSTSEKCVKPSKTKRNSRGGNPHPAPRFAPQNRASLKHGGYARRLRVSDANLEDAAALTLEDELLRVRAANLEAAENIGRWKTQLVDAKGDMIDVLMKRIEDAHRAMDRNTARMESLTAGINLGRKAEAETLLKLAARDKAVFESSLSHLETERRELVNKKIQADIDRADPASKDNLVTVYHALEVPGAMNREEYRQARLEMLEEDDC